MRLPLIVVLMGLCVTARGAGLGTRLQYLWSQTHNQESCAWSDDQGVSRTTDATAYPLPTAAEIAAVTDAQIEAWRAPYPQPEVIVPLLRDGVPIGTATLAIDAATMEPIASTNTASPRRPWSVQRADMTNDVGRASTLRADVRKLKVSQTNNLAQFKAIPAAAASGTTAQQLTALRAEVAALRVELVDAAQDNKELRRILAKVIKGE